LNTPRTHFGKNIFSYGGSAFVWPTLPARVDLISDHENEGCFRQSENFSENRPRGYITKNGGGRLGELVILGSFLSEATAAAFYFFLLKSLKISSKALSITASRLFSTILNSCASSNASCFRFSFFSFSLYDVLLVRITLPPI